MKNIVTISIHFHYKGVKHSPSMTVELDEFTLTTSDLSPFYPLLAKENNYDLYSYEYEMMQAEELHFSNAQGLISDFINNNKLEVTAFLEAWKKTSSLAQLEKIAKDDMGISNSEEQPDLIKALLKAYELGQKNPK